MTIVGKEYSAKGTDAKERGIAKRRAIYCVGGEYQTPEQKKIIARLEKGFHGDWDDRDPYNMMRNAQYMGIELGEEELCPDGKWREVGNPDILISLGQKGAL